MALIRRIDFRWQVAADEFAAAGLEGPLPEGAILVPLKRFLEERETLLARNTPLGVLLSSEQSPDILHADVHHLALIAIEFPKFRDGRGYSWARQLRQRWRYEGELRAVGEVLRDQWLFMARCGYDAFAVRPGTALGTFEAVLREQSVFYQPAADELGRIGRGTARQPIAAE